MSATREGSGSDKPSSLAEALAAGFKRCFVADEPRLSEAVQTYEEIGHEVLLLPVPLDDEGCTECIRQDPDRYRLIMTRLVSPRRC